MFWRWRLIRQEPNRHAEVKPINPGDRCQEDTQLSQEPITASLFAHHGTPYVICGQDLVEFSLQSHKEAVLNLGGKTVLYHVSLDGSLGYM